MAKNAGLDDGKSEPSCETWEALVAETWRAFPPSRTDCPALIAGLKSIIAAAIMWVVCFTTAN